MVAELSDDLLMNAVVRGDERAFASLVARHERAVLCFCRQILQSDARAADAAQETFVKLWLQRERYRESGKLRALLFTIARNHCRSSERKARVRRLFFAKSIHDEEKIQEGAERALFQNEAHAALAQALDRLPTAFREVLLLRFVEELDYRDIARIIGRTPEAARSRVHLGLKRVAALLPEGVWP